MSDDRPATRGDILKMEERVKGTIELVVKPVGEDVAGHRKTLYGDDGRGGLTKDVGILKWTLGGIATGIGAVILSMWDKIKQAFWGHF